MKNLSLKILSVVFLLVFACTSCDKDPVLPDDGPDINPGGGSDGNNSLTFNSVVETGGTIPAPTLSNISTPGESYEEVIGNTTWECTTETVSIETGAGGNGGFPMFSPNSNVIYPGNLIQGKSLGQGTPDVIAVDRAGGTISTDVVDGNIASTFEVDEISKSSVTDAINNIIANSTGILPANFSLSIENIQSKEEFALSVGLDVNTTFNDFAADINYNSETEKNTFIVNLTQSFYTMSYDIPTSLDDIFAPSVTPEDLAKYVGEGNPATYISDVTYGRIYYMLIESSSSVQEMDAKINNSFNGVAVDVDAEIETSYLNELSELKISVFAYGGESSSTFPTTGTTNISDLADLLGEGSIIEAGKPLSYVVRSVYDNQIVSTQLATSYDVTNCEPVGIASPLPATVHWTGKVNDLLGPVTAAYADGPDRFILMNAQGDWLVSTVQANGEGSIEGPFQASDWIGLPFDNIGAACRIGGTGTGLYVFNGIGNKYAVYFGNGDWTTVHDISEFHDGDCPFINTGTGAMAYIGNLPNTNPFGGIPYGESHFMFDQSGENYAQSGLLSFSGSHFYDPQNVQTGFGINGKIDAVGAAIGYDNGGSSGNTRIHILFDQSGTQYVVWGDFGNGTETIGPFGL